MARVKIRPADLRNISIDERDTVKSVVQNIAVLLSTRKGTVPMYREFGLDWRALDKPMPRALQLLRVDIKEAIEEFEPRAQVLSIEFEADASNPGMLISSVEVEILEQ